MHDGACVNPNIPDEFKRGGCEAIVRTSPCACKGATWMSPELKRQHHLALEVEYKEGLRSVFLDHYYHSRVVYHRRPYCK